MSLTTRRMVESAILIAIGTLLSLVSFAGPWLRGGSVTACSMLPLVIIAQRHGTKWGLFSALIYAILQMILGMKNVGLGRNVMEVGLIILLDYIIAFTVIGLSAAFGKRGTLQSILIGIGITFALRFLCHFASGIIIWNAIYPNTEGQTAALYSLIYNGSYMLPEVIVTGLVASLSYLPLKRFWQGQDLPSLAS